MLHIVRPSMFLMRSQSFLLQIEGRQRIEKTSSVVGTESKFLPHRIVKSVQVHINVNLEHNITGTPKPVIISSEGRTRHFNHSLSFTHPDLCMYIHVYIHICKMCTLIIERNEKLTVTAYLFHLYFSYYNGAGCTRQKFINSFIYHLVILSSIIAHAHS